MSMSAEARPAVARAAVGTLALSEEVGNRENGDYQVSEEFLASTINNLSFFASPTHGDSTKKPTIYKVPTDLKRGNEPDGYGDSKIDKCYEPVAVGIGAFNMRWKNESSQQLQDYKWCCVQQLINRHNHLLEPARSRALLVLCLDRMKYLEPEIRACYSRLVTSGTSDDLALRMLLDGCFILHRLLKYARLSEREADGSVSDPQFDDDDWTQVFGRCWVWQFATRDLLLLENQIPFFIVGELFKMLRNDGEPVEDIVKGSRRLFRDLRPEMMHSSPIACDRVHHLLHLFYLLVSFPTGHRRLRRRRQRHARYLLPLKTPRWIPCARELEEAGVRFRKRKGATSFLDIRFARGVLEIPPLQLYDSSDALFRNLIAFEQSYPDTRRDISTYAVFMDCLVNTPEDMRILHLRGILVNQMNGDEQDANRFFSTICAQVHLSADNYLVDLMSDVNRYKDCTRHKWRAVFVRNYFSNPWVIMSVLAALLLLCMTMLQTFFTVYPYFRPSN